MISVPKILKKFEEAMASSAFAEEGEFEMARQFPRQETSSNKKVLLGTDDREIDLKIIGYALKLCQRVEAGLEILHLVKGNEIKRKTGRPSKSSPGLTRMETMLREMGIVYHPVTATASLENELVNQVAKRRDIMFVVLGGGRKKDQPEITEAFGKLRCPLVIYEDAVKAS